MSSDIANPNMPRPNNEAARGGAAIGAKTRIKGELQADEDLRVEGHFDGTLQLQKHQLEIGPKGVVEGTAFAHSITVEGNMEGDLYAIERISIRKGATVKGNVMAPRVSLEDGAVLRGTVEMDNEAIRTAIAEKFKDAELAPTPAAKPVENKAPMPSHTPSHTPTVAPARAGNDGKPDANKPDLGQKPGQGPTAVSKQA
ncbi:MAG: bactofilin family protein [Oceanococcus sp.]